MKKYLIVYFAAVALCLGMGIHHALADSVSGGGSSISTPVSIANGGAGVANLYAGPYLPDPTAWIFGFCSYQKTTGVLAWTCTGGLQVQTDNGSKTNATCLDGAGVCQQYTTGAVAGNLGGLTQSGADVRATAPMRLTITMSFDSIASRRIWCGYSSGSIGSHAPPTGSAASALKYIAIAADDSVNSGKFLAASGDGTNETGTDTGVTPVANTKAVVDLDCSNLNTSCRIGVNGTYITKSTNLPAGGSDMGVTCFVETRTTAAKVLQIKHGYAMAWPL